MGIKGLLPELEDAIASCHIEQLRGKRAAIDVSGWIYKALRSPESRCDVHQYVFRRVNFLNYHNIEVILVFDGPAPPAKNDILENRKKLKEKKNSIDPDDKTLRNLCARSGTLQKLLKNFCILHRIAYVQAPFEADAQIAYMVRTGEVNLVISDDSDFIVFGCQRILFKFKSSQGKLFEQEKFERCWKAPYNMELFRAMCIAIGSDYFKGGLIGFGIVAARHLYPKMFPTFEMNRLMTSVKGQVDEKFEEKFKRAVNTFLFQPVYDKYTKTTVPLNSYPEGTSALDFIYAGDPNLSQGDHYEPGEDAQELQPRRTDDQQRLTPYACRECPQVFENKIDRKAHSFEVHPHQCEVCDKTYAYKHLLEDHMLLHGEKPTISCMTCGKELWTRQRLSRHKFRIHKNDFSACSICGRQFRNSYLLGLHVSNVHQDGKHHKCDTCGAAFKNRKNLYTHVVFVHSYERPHKCEICQKAFKSRTCLKTHLKSHANERPHKCSHCPKAFNYLQNLEYHERVHTCERPYKCSYCPKRFTRPDYFRVHQRIHLGIKRYICTKCNKGFVTSDSLKKHMRVHTGEKPFKCTFCEKGFSQRNCWKEHMIVCKNRPNPNEDLPHKCQFCVKRFATTRRKTLHERIHSGNRPFNCIFCDKDFLRYSDLEAHMRVHTEEKPFACTFCEKEFTQGNSRAKHMIECRIRTNSNEEFPFKCEFCERRFQRRASMSVHVIRSHSGQSGPQKPFKCPECGTGFAWKTSLQKHKKTSCHVLPSSGFPGVQTMSVHVNQSHSGQSGPDKPFKCPECGTGFAWRSGLSKHKKKSGHVKPSSS